MLHRFLGAYVRYAAHVVAYVTLAAEPVPGFTGRAGSYPVDVEIDPPGRQNRWMTGFRLFLALPAILLADTMVGLRHERRRAARRSSGGVAATAAFLGWFACVVARPHAEGLRDLVAYAIGYSAQVTGYLLLLTDRYPNSDPAVYEAANVYRERPDPAAGRRRPAALAADGLLPPAARAPALRLARCCGASRRSSRRSRTGS